MSNIQITHIEDTIANLRSGPRAKMWSYATDLDSVVYFQGVAKTEKHLYTLDGNDNSLYAVNNFTTSGATISGTASFIGVSANNNADFVIENPAGGDAYILFTTGENWTIGHDYDNDNMSLRICKSTGFEINNQYLSFPDPTFAKTIAIGIECGISFATEDDNTIAIGYQAAGFIPWAPNCIALGRTALGGEMPYVSNIIAIGYEAGWNMGENSTDNIAIGRNTLQYCTDGGYNVAIGSYALNALTEGLHNMGIGYYAGKSITTGERNIILGTSACENLTSGSYNVAIGKEAGNSAVTNSSCVFIGYQSGYYETSDNKLHISSISATNIPLIYGDFSSQYIDIYGNFSAGFSSVISLSGVHNLFKNCGSDTQTGIRYNVGQTSAVPTSGTFTRSTDDPVRFVSDSGSLTDDGQLVIVNEAGTNGEKLNGHGWVSCGDELTHFSFIDGTVSISLSSTNIASSNSDGNLCIVGTNAIGSGNSTKITIFNRLGQTENISYYVSYSLNESS